MIQKSEHELVLVLYSTPYCIFCRMAKDYFKEHGVVYRELNVSEDVDAREAMAKKSGQTGVPVIDINGNIIVGFDRTRLESILEKVNHDS